ncbi:MAG: hypothetical protein ACR2N2_06065 [Acidimicrobiia bacterium]
MDTPQHRIDGWIDILWALVVLQGAVLALSVAEVLVMNAMTGFLLVGNLVLTLAATTAAFLAARGIRRRRIWARRLTLVAQWFIIVFATIDAVISILLSGAPPDLIPVMTGLMIPIVILVFLRKTKAAFNVAIEVDVTVDEPTEDPVVGMVA